MRICILTKGEPYGWTRHYIAAFRESGHDVLAVGPNITADTLRAFQLEHLDAAASRTDIETDLGPSVTLADVLPAIWRPELIVAISMAGTPLCPNFAGVPCPRVYLSIDTWQSPRDYLDALQYDLVFTAQKSFAARMRAMGARNVAWLPLAFNPKEHFPVEMEPRVDVSFVGTISLPIHQERHELVRRLKSEVRLAGKTALFGPAMCAFCSAGKLTFNHSAVHDVNMRVFEAIGMRCALLTNSQAAENGLFDLFQDGEHLIAYSDEETLIRQTRRYLDDEASRQRIREAARAVAVERHTYRHRVDSIVEAALRCASNRARDTRDMSPLVEALPMGAEVVSVLGDGLAGVDWCGVRAPHRVVPGEAEGAEAIVVSLLSTPATQVAETLSKSALRLADGDTLLLLARPEDVRALGFLIDPVTLQKWLLPFGFVLTMAMLTDQVRPGETLVLLSARKRSTTMAQIVDDAFRTLPANCQQVRDDIHAWQLAQAPDL